MSSNLQEMAEGLESEAEDLRAQARAMEKDAKILSLLAKLDENKSREAAIIEHFDDKKASRKELRNVLHELARLMDADHSLTNSLQMRVLEMMEVGVPTYELIVRGVFVREGDEPEQAEDPGSEAERLPQPRPPVRIKLRDGMTVGDAIGIKRETSKPDSSAQSGPTRWQLEFELPDGWRVDTADPSNMGFLDPSGGWFRSLPLSISPNGLYIDFPQLSGGSPPVDKTAGTKGYDGDPLSCRQCGELLSPRWNNCPMCGTNISEEKHPRLELILEAARQSLTGRTIESMLAEQGWMYDGLYYVDSEGNRWSHIRMGLFPTHVTVQPMTRAPKLAPEVEKPEETTRPAAEEDQNEAVDKQSGRWMDPHQPITLDQVETRSLGSEPDGRFILASTGSGKTNQIPEPIENPEVM